MPILNVIDISKLRLEQRIRFHFSDVYRRPVQRYLLSELVLKSEIEFIANIPGIPAKLPYFLSYLYHIGARNLKETSDYVSPIIKSGLIKLKSDERDTPKYTPEYFGAPIVATIASEEGLSSSTK